MEIQYQYLRPEKAKALRKWVTDPVEVRDEPAVLALENAVIYPLRRGFGLLFGKGAFWTNRAIMSRNPAFPAG